MTYLPTNKEFLGELRMLIAGYAEEDDEVLAESGMELKQSLIKIIKQTSIVRQLESENKRLRKLSADFYKALIRSDNNMLEAVSYSIWEETQMDIQRLGARLKKEGI